MGKAGGAQAQRRVRCPPNHVRAKVLNIDFRARKPDAVAEDQPHPGWEPGMVPEAPAAPDTESWLGALMTHLADGLLAFDLTGRYLEANPAACELLGYTREELLALHPWDLVQDASRAELLSAWHETQINEAVAAEHCYRCKDGRLVIVEERWRRFKLGQQDLLVVICRDVTERNELEAKLRESEAALQDSEQLAEERRQAAVHEERNRLARDIHDTLAQGFTGIIVQLEAARDALLIGNTSEAEQHFCCAGELARQSLSEARRSVRALRPRALQTATLAEALERLIKQMTPGTGVTGEMIVEGEPRRLSPDWEEDLLRIGQEALTNTLKYARAAKFVARLHFGPREVCLVFEDDGCGFNPQAATDGFGLSGIQQRVERLGGKLIVHSAPGQGARIEISLPDIVTAKEPPA